MTTAYTSLLGLALPVTGELSGTWGDTVNNSITSLLDTAVAGTTTISSDADVTLTTTTGTGNQARQAIILWTAGGTVTRTITAPAQSKSYIVINKTSSTQSIKLVGTGPTTGVTIIAGESAVCAWNGVDFIKTSSTIANAAGSNTQIQFNNSGVLGGSANLTWDGSFLTAASIKNSALTNTRVTFAGASGLLSDSANLTFNGTTLTAAGLSDSGNLTFTGTGNRITGDFTNATQVNRVAFQTSTTNGLTTLTVIPNGTATQTAINLFDNSDPTNAGTLGIVSNSTEKSVRSSITGTGTYLPMTFYTGGSERMRIATDGKVGIGTASAAVSFAISSTDAILIPAGTTAQQPTGVAGYLRFNTTTTQFEGYNGTSWASVGGATLSNDTSTSSNVYPLFASATSGSATTIYTSNANLLYKPSTGELTALAMISSNGINVNSQTVSASYTIAAGNNGLSAGTVSVATGITVTVATGSVWTVV